jgi:hypothetical protein
VLKRKTSCDTHTQTPCLLLHIDFPHYNGETRVIQHVYSFFILLMITKTTNNS